MLELIYNFHFFSIDLMLLKQVELKTFQCFMLNPLKVFKELVGFRQF